jgi:hypothetical protein
MMFLPVVTIARKQPDLVGKMDFILQKSGRARLQDKAFGSRGLSSITVKAKFK